MSFGFGFGMASSHFGYEIDGGLFFDDGITYLTWDDGITDLIWDT